MTLEEAKKFIDEAVEAAKPIVFKIESRPPSTKDYYAEYMGVLARVDDKRARQRLAAILIKAGANQNGVLTALSLT